MVFSMGSLCSFVCKSVCFCVLFFVGVSVLFTPPLFFFVCWGMCILPLWGFFFHGILWVAFAKKILLLFLCVRHIALSLFVVCLINDLHTWLIVGSSRGGLPIFFIVMGSLTCTGPWYWHTVVLFPLSQNIFNTFLKICFEGWW